MNKKMFAFLLFVLVCLIWGTTWMGMKIAVETIPPIFATGVRFLIAAPILIVITRWLNQPLLFPKQQQKWMLFVTIGYFAIPFTLMIIGEQYISSGLAAIIFANMPITVMIASTFFLGLRLEAHQIVGLLMAVFSLLIILMNEMDVGGKDYLIGCLALGGALTMHTCMYVFVQKYCKDVSVLTYNALPNLIASILLLITSYFVENINIDSFSAQSISAVVYLGIIGSTMGCTAYFKLNQVFSPFSASICFLIFPLIALELSNVIYHHMISGISLLMLLPLLGGILLSKISKAFFAKKLRTFKTDRSIA